jgi:chromate reductase
MRVLGLPGSLRAASYSRRVLSAATATLPSTATFAVFEGLAQVPPFSEDLPGHRAVDRLRLAIGGADAVLISTPEYNASIPGQLKNALDWASTPFEDNVLRGKPVAVVGASTGLFGAVWAQAELRKVLRTIGARVVDAEVSVASVHTAFDESGRLSDGYRSGLRQVVDELVLTACGGACETQPVSSG